jgi:dephospho-CoA kinase
MSKKTPTSYCLVPDLTGEEPQKKIPIRLLRPLAELIATTMALRHPQKGCPWDLKQDHKSLMTYLLEESYEAIEAAENEDSEEFCQELGDLLFQVVLNAQIASETGQFDFGDIASGIHKKLVERHPHVFHSERPDFKNTRKSSANPNSANPKSKNSAPLSWEQLKSKLEKRDSVLEGVPKNLPALQKASRLTDKAAQVGFEFPALSFLFEKLDEEISEFKQELSDFDLSKIDSSALINPKVKKRLQEECGDILFVCANIARFLQFDPEQALRGTNQRFEQRFKTVEQKVKENDGGFSETNLATMERYWEEAKMETRANRVRTIGITGGIASGKSLVSDYLRKHGYAVVDADQLARKVTEAGGSGIEAIRTHFGEEYIDQHGALDRKKMRQLIFNDPTEKQKLEGLIHPLIRKLGLEKVQIYGQQGHSLVFYDAALLFESGAHHYCQDVILVSCAEDLQIERVIKRDRVSRSEAIKIIQSQMPLKEKEKLARWVVDNSGLKAKTFEQVDHILKALSQDKAIR